MTMAKFNIRGFIGAAVLTATLSVVLMGMHVRPAAAQAACGGGDGGGDIIFLAQIPSDSCPPPPDPTPVAPLPPPVTGAGSSATSIGGLVDQRTNQMITNRVLGTVLLGVNEQINCSDCV